MPAGEGRQPAPDHATAPDGGPKPAGRKPIRVVLCLPLRTAPDGERVLLGLKKRGFGKGRIVAPGGKIEPGEGPAQAAARELAEETALEVDPGDLVHAGNVHFVFPARPASDMACAVFLAPTATGAERETDELAPRWYPVEALPLGRMWEDSALWLPALLSGERFTARVTLAADNLAVAHYEARAKA